MNYIIYTDGSCKPDMERAAYSYIIRTKKKCVKIGYASYDGRHILGAEISLCGRLSGIWYRPSG